MRTGRGEFYEEEIGIAGDGECPAAEVDPGTEISVVAGQINVIRRIDRHCVSDIDPGATKPFRPKGTPRGRVLRKKDIGIPNGIDRSCPKINGGIETSGDPYVVGAVDHESIGIIITRASEAFGPRMGPARR